MRLSWLFVLLFSGCQIGYLMKSAYSQADLLRRRVPISEAIRDPSLSEDSRRKLLLAEEAHAFAASDLGLARTRSYSSFVQLDQPYVTWVVSASARDELKHHLWKYPVVGEMPYKGFFEPEGAKEEAASLRASGLDTYIRGVSAYSTLGWFRDPVLSSMLAYKDYELVSTIIHETTHATVFIRSEADFNERLAEFIGQKGAEAFYLKREGPSGPTLQKMRDDLEDERVFGEFISRELKSMEQWYVDHRGSAIPEEVRVSRLHEIQSRFAIEVVPHLRDRENFARFEKAELNNARLLTYKLYFQDLSQFQRVFDKLGHDFSKMLDFARSLEKSDDPVAELAKAAST